jgi:hypothetical protein
VRYRNIANSDPDTVNAASCTPVKDGSLNSPSGSIGSLARRWMATNATRRAAEPANSDTIRRLPQPSAFPRNSASTSSNSAPLKVAAPAQSTRLALGSRLSRSFSWVTASAANPTGRLR